MDTIDDIFPNEEQRNKLFMIMINNNSSGFILKGKHKPYLEIIDKAVPLNTGTYIGDKHKIYKFGNTEFLPVELKIDTNWKKDVIQDNKYYGVD